ncbi:hypothetical protein GQ457_04G012730 [Hibiscus cannabinus]
MSSAMSKFVYPTRTCFSLPKQSFNLELPRMLGPTAFINTQRKNNTMIPPKIHARKSDPGGRDTKNLLDFG